MTDRKKVINALQQCVGYEDDDNKYTCIYDGDINPNCPYGGTGGDGVSCMTKMMRDALALLKAQEPVEPILDIRHGKSMWRCGSCSTALQPNQMHAKFCFNCGRAVKWDD